MVMGKTTMRVQSVPKAWGLRLPVALFSMVASLPITAPAGSIFDDDYKPPPVHAPRPDSSTPNPPPQPSAVPAPVPEPAPPPAPRIKPTVQGAQKGLRYPLPVPAKSACTEADKLVREVFHDEFAKATPADKMALGAKLLSEASAEGNDPVTRYVLLKDGIDASESAGDAVRALQAIEMLGRNFAIDLQSMKLDALTLATKSSITPSLAHTMTLTALALSEESLLAGRYELCVKAAQVAETLARKSHEAGMIGWASDWVHDTDAIQQEAQRIAPSLAKVKEGKAEASANTDVGRFFCLYCGRWEPGLPLLAKGSDAGLKSLATKELGASDLDPAAQVSLGDAWADLASKQNGFVKDATESWACHRYRLAEPTLTGLSKLTVDKKIRELAIPRALHGLVAEIYRGRFFESKAATRIDSSIDFDWNSTEPEPGVARNYFSVKWTGWLKAPVPGIYKILSRVDDSARVWIDGKLVIDRWNQIGIFSDSASVTLGTDPVELRVEYWQKESGALMGLGWVAPGAVRARAIPITALLHEPVDMRDLLPNTPRPDRDGSIMLRAADASVFGSRLGLYDTDDQIDKLGWWYSPSDWATWKFTAPPGDYDLRLNLGVEGRCAGSTYTISVGGAELTGTTSDTGGWSTLAEQTVGRVHLPGGGQTLSIKPITVNGIFMDLHAITLTPAKAE